MMTVLTFPAAPGRDTTELELNFFRSRLQEEQDALRNAWSEAAACRHRALIARYETVLKLYVGEEASQQHGNARRG